MKLLDRLGRLSSKNTPVADVRGIVQIVMLMRGKQAARIRQQAAELLVRYLGGDVALPGSFPGGSKTKMQI